MVRVFLGFAWMLVCLLVCVCLDICLHVSLSVCLVVCLRMCLFVCLYVHTLDRTPWQYLHVCAHVLLHMHAQHFIRLTHDLASRIANAVLVRLC